MAAQLLSIIGEPDTPDLIKLLCSMLKTFHRYAAYKIATRHQASLLWGGRVVRNTGDGLLAEFGVL
jgi:hypothetical protein